MVAARSTSYIYPRHPAITGLGNGTYAVAFEDTNSTGFRIVDGTGAPVGAATIRGAGTGGIYTQKPVVAGLSGGGFVVVWLESPMTGDYAVKAQRYDAAGAAVGSVISVTSAGSNVSTVLKVRALASGGFAVVWADPVHGSTPYVVDGRIYDASGMAGDVLTLESLPNIVDTTTGAAPAFDVAALSGGGLAVVWEANNAAMGATWRDIKGQVFNASGVVQGAAVAISDGANDASLPSVAGVAGGGFAVGWQSRVASSGLSFASVIRTRMFSAAGQAQGADAVASDGGSSEVSLTALSDGGFVAVWGNTAGSEIQVFDGAGAMTVPKLVFGDAATAETLSVPVIAGGAGGASGGGFAIAWQSVIQTTDGGSSVKVRTYTKH